MMPSGTLRHLICGLLAVAFGWLAAPMGAAAAAPDHLVASYTYDAPSYDAPTTHTALERGPPAQSLGYTVVAPDHRWSPGAPVHLDAGSIAAITACAHHEMTAQGARTRTTPGGHVVLAHDDSSPSAQAGVAANNATRLGETVSPLGRTYENSDTYLGDVANHYGINLRGVRAVWDHSLGPVTKGLTRQSEGGWIIRINPGFVDEADLANTIAHELSHARDFQKGLSSFEGPATASGNALEEWIYGLR